MPGVELAAKLYIFIITVFGMVLNLITEIENRGWIQGDRETPRDTM